MTTRPGERVVGAQHERELGDAALHVSHLGIESHLVHESSPQIVATTPA